MNISKSKQNQVIRMIKAKAFNQIQHVHSKYFVYDTSSPYDNTYSDQRDEEVCRIFEEMHKEIHAYKEKIRKYLQSFQ